MCIYVQLHRVVLHTYTHVRVPIPYHNVYTHSSFETSPPARGPDVGLDAPHRDLPQSTPNVPETIRVTNARPSVYTFTDICSHTIMYIHVPVQRVFVYPYTHVRVTTHIAEYIHICRAYMCVVVAQYISTIYSQDGVMCRKGRLLSL
jgi:hypothetical protein